jgi:hypothetical protein
LNLFWYNYWYSDQNKSFQIHQDNLINKLLYIYLNYGILKKSFKNTYKFWNFSNLNAVHLYFEEENERLLQYIRLAQYRNKVTTEIDILQFRVRRKNLHFTKFWILRYGKWLIINVYALQPLKKKFSFSVIKKKKKIKAFALLRINNIRYFKKNLIRQLLIFNFFKNQELIAQNSYFF